MANQLTGLHAKFTGDASSFVRASRLAAFEANKLDAKLRQTKKAQDDAATSSAALSKEYARMKMETDSAYASQVRFQKAAELVARVAKEQKWSVEQVNSELARLATHYNVAEMAGLSMNDQVRSARFHTANLAAQFNDIGVMLAAGQSPFMLAIQQGTQITQVLQDMGGGVRQTFSALGGAFRSLISPISLLTIGTIAAGAALVQWGLSALGAMDNARGFDAILGDVEGSLSRLNELGKATSAEGLTQLKEKYGEVNAELALFISRMKEAEEARAMEALNEAVGNLADEFSSAFAALTAPAEDLDIVAQMLYDDFGLTLQQVRDLEIAFKEAASATTFSEQQVALTKVRELLAQSSKRGSELYYNVLKAEDAMRQLVAAAPDSGWLGAAIKSANDLASAFWEAARAKVAATSSAAGPGMSTGTSDWAQNSLGFTLPGNELLPPSSAFGAGTGNAAAAGGGVNPAEQLQGELDRLQEGLKTAQQIEAENYLERQTLLEDALKQKLITQQEYAAMMEQVERTHQYAMTRQTHEGVKDTLTALGNLFQGSKQIGAAIAVANSWMAFTEVLKDPSFVGRPWARFAAAASALSSGLAAVRNIKSAQVGGSTGGAASASAGAGVGGAAAGQAQQTQVQTFNFSIQNDPFGYGERIVRQLATQLNQAARNGVNIQAVVR